MLRTKAHLGWKTSDRASHRGHRDVCENRDGPVTGDDHARPTAPWEIDVVNPAAVQSGSPPSARWKASISAKPASPIHSSWGCSPYPRR